MKIVITGALGHIGSQVLRDLAYVFPQAHIVLIDNLMTQRFVSLFNLPVIGQYTFIEGDITNIDLSSHLMDAYVVIHLAAITDATASFDRQSEVEANNYISTVKVAHACAVAGVRLISLSSTSVYGTQSNLVTEDCSEDELKPQSPYALTKLREEKLVSEMCINKDLKAIILRFGTIFGASPGMRFHTAVNKFCWQAIMGQPITVWRTALDQKRPYLDLFDASRAIEFIIRNDLFDGRIYNVLTINATVRQIVDSIREFVPELQVTFVDSKIMNQLSYEVCSDRLRFEGFTYAGSLNRGVGETISLLRKSNVAYMS